MPTSTDPTRAKDELFYASTSEPTDPTDPSEYVECGMLISAPFTSTGQSETIVFRQGVKQLYDDNVVTGSIECYVPKTNDDGHTLLRNAQKANPKTPLWVMKTTGEIGSTGEHGKAEVADRTDGGGATGGLTRSFTLSFEGETTDFVVA